MVAPSKPLRIRGGGWLKPAVCARTISPFFFLSLLSHAAASSSISNIKTLSSPVARAGVAPRAKGHLDGGAPRPTTRWPVPAPAEGVVADGQTVEGVRIGAAGALEILELDLESRKAKDCLAESFTLDGATFDYVPIPLLLGIPLRFKRLLDVPTEGEDAEELRYETKMYVYKLMTTPGLGLPLTWNQNGSGTKLPPVLACRSDGVPFTQDDWACLCEFHEYLDENYVEKEQLWYINKPEFKKWVGIWTRAMCLKSDKANPYAFAEIAPCFEHRFPIGIQVRANGLKKAELNGRLGTVKRYDEEQLRVGVEFAAPFGLLSLKHTNLEMADGGAERSKMLLAKYERQKAERKERK